MACILYELLLIGQSPHYKFYAPGPRPSTWVLNCEPVKKMIFIQALPALGEMRLFGVAIGERPTHPPILEIRVINDEYIALPVPACGSLILPNLLRRPRTSVQVNHLRFMGFRTNDHHVTALHNLEGALLASWT